MGFFDDFTNALETYPETEVQLEIVEVSFPDSVLNVEETATFRVKVTNTGPLNLTDVSLRIKGLNGATVANNGAAAPFVSEFVTQTIDSIAAHGGSQTTVGSPLKFKAPSSAQDSLNLVRATLEDWNANPDHIFDGHSDPLDTVRANFAAEVVPK
jgi:hypothetical protein